jgi:hypothetical protein
LLSRLGGDAKAEQRSGSRIFRGIEADVVKTFIGGYRFHPGARTQSADLLNGYIDAQMATGDLTSWNVAFVGKSSANRNRTVGDAEIGLIERSKLRSSDSSTARLGVIASASDLIADLPAARLPEGQGALDEILRMRGGIPLLLLYFIDRDSPASSLKTRVPLEALDDLVGLAFLFPKGRFDTPQKYKTADLSGVEREDADLFVPDVDDEGDQATK